MFCQGINCGAADSTGNVYISLRLSSYLMLNPYPLALKYGGKKEREKKIKWNFGVVFG